MAKLVAVLVALMLAGCGTAAPTEAPSTGPGGLQAAADGPDAPNGIPTRGRFLFQAMLKDDGEELKAILDLQIATGELGNTAPQIIAGLRVLDFPGVKKAEIFMGPIRVLTLYDGSPFAMSQGLLFRSLYTELDLAPGFDIQDVIALARQASLSALAVTQDGPQGDFLTIAGDIR